MVVQESNIGISYRILLKKSGKVSSYLWDASRGIGLAKYQWSPTCEQEFSTLDETTDFLEAYLRVVEHNTTNVTKEDVLRFAQNIEIVCSSVTTYDIKSL